MPAVKRVSRRTLVRGGLLAAIAVGLGGIFQQRDSMRFGPGLARALWRRAVGDWATVSIARCPTYADATLAVQQAWDAIGGPSLAGKRVVLKPNLVDYMPDRPIHTAIEILEAAIGYLRAHDVAEVVVADGPSFNRDTDYLLAESGLGDRLERQRVPFIDLNYDDLDRVPLVGNYGRLTSLSLPRTITRADLVISVPKMKTHHWAGVSLSMKNLFGVVPGVEYGWPKNSLHTNGIVQSILAINATVRPGLALVDGVVGLEGDGPIYGEAKPTGVVMMGTDLVALDATAARVMGFGLENVDHVRVAGQLGLGIADADRILVLGESVAAVARHYAPPPRLPEGKWANGAR
jgi:uncharacterized protein (DUF362 family)